MALSAGTVAAQASPDQTRRVAALALAKATSPDFVGYWQRQRVV